MAHMNFLDVFASSESAYLTHRYWHSDSHIHTVTMGTCKHLLHILHLPTMEYSSHRLHKQEI